MASELTQLTSMLKNVRISESSSGDTVSCLLEKSLITCLKLSDISSILDIIKKDQKHRCCK